MKNTREFQRWIVKIYLRPLSNSFRISPIIYFSLFSSSSSSFRCEKALDFGRNSASTQSVVQRREISSSSGYDGEQ